MEKLLGQLYPEDTGDISKVLGGGRSVDVDIDMLDYGFVEKCKDPVQLEAILEVLRSGKEGYYPHLEEFTYKHLCQLAPEKFIPLNERPTFDQMEAVKQEMNEWQKSLSQNNNVGRIGTVSTNDDSTILNSPLAKLSEDCKSSINKMRSRLDVDTLRRLAETEKQKGNESLKAGDFKDAIKSYTKSLLILPQSHVFSNRSLAYYKLKHYGHVIEDAGNAIRLNCDNIKAYYWRAMAHKALKSVDKALVDLESVMELDNSYENARKEYEELKKVESITAATTTTTTSIPIVETDSDSDEISSDEEEEEAPRIKEL